MNKKVLTCIMKISPLKNNVDNLREFLDSTEKNLKSLEMLNENISQHMFVSIIKSKLCQEDLRQLELMKERHANGQFRLSENNCVNNCAHVNTRKWKKEQFKHLHSKLQVSVNGTKYIFIVGSKIDTIGV